MLFLHTKMDSRFRGNDGKAYNHCHAELDSASCCAIRLRVKPAMTDGLNIRSIV